MFVDLISCSIWCNIQVEHLIELEESLPMWVLRRVRIKQHVEYPNQPKTLLTKVTMSFGGDCNDGPGSNDMMMMMMTRMMMVIPVMMMMMKAVMLKMVNMIAVMIIMVILMDIVMTMTA